MSSIGAPWRREGIKSMKVWVIAIETKKTAKGGERKGIAKARRFTCMPGIKPETIPAKKPAKISSNIDKSPVLLKLEKIELFLLCK